MPDWRVDRIDFTRGARCGFCNSPLKSGVGHVLIAADGEEAFAGERCAGRNGRFPDSPIPDFCRATPAAPSDDEAPEGEGDRGRSVRTVAHRAKTLQAGDMEVEYLRLRAELLKGFSVEPDGRLWRIHGRYREGRLSHGDRSYLKNLIAKFEREGSRLSFENLQTCYAYGAALELFLAEERHEYIESVFEFLKNTRTLTAAQLEAVNRFFANREGFPRLEPMAFSKYAG